MALSRHFADGVETVVYTDAKGNAFDATPTGLPALVVAEPAKPEQGKVVHADPQPTANAGPVKFLNEPAPEKLD